MYTLLSTQTSLGLEEKQSSIVVDWYRTALYNVREFLQDLDENEDYTLTKTENKFVIERWDNTYIQEWHEWDVHKNFDDDGYDFLGFIF